MHVLKQNPQKINIKYLDQFEKFKQFRTLKKTNQIQQKTPEEEQEQTPKEALESAYQSLRNDLANEPQF